MATIADISRDLTAPGQPFEIAEAVIRGVPTKIWKNAAPTLRDVLSQSRRHGESVFLVYEDERMTFEEHFRSSAHLANVLVDRFGIEKGDRVAIAMRNYPEWALAFWAITSAGAVVVPLNAWWTGPELEYGLADSGARLLFVDSEREERLRANLPACVENVIVARAEQEPDDGHLRFEDVLGDVPADAELPGVDLDTEDDATIFYTSGTTGNPKGALGTHRNICTNLSSLFFINARTQARKKAMGVTDDRPAPAQNSYLLSVPFFHATGCHSVLVSNTAAGGKLVIMYKWDAGRALELIEREQVTTFGGVPAMAMQVLDHPDFAKRDTSSVRSVAYGGAPAPPDLVRRIKELFPGGSPSNGYGLTETSSVTTMNQGDDYVRKPDSVGVPVPVCEVKVVDDDGNELPPGSVGELWIKGPNVVKGYFNKPEATAASFSDGWLHSGDVARIDEEGYVYIVDRAKDMVIRGGENVYCVEVEAALHEHPAVSDAAVIGIPHPVLGEEVGAVVRLRTGMTATEEELRSHVRERLAAFKVPSKVWFRGEELPRNPAGKILKRELREELVGS
ncbi:MAG: class I adenylate-forming enzyme family protein [Acidimicrobiia bacterium]